MATRLSCLLTVRGIALEHKTHLPLLLLQPLEGPNVVPIQVGPAEASSIIIEIEGVLPPRPLTHDLIVELFRRDHLVPKRLEIYELRKDEFFARLVYSKGLRRRTIEVRPSDGVALAVRLDVPIVTAPEIIEATAASLSSFEDVEIGAAEVLYLDSTRPVWFRQA